MDKYKFTDANDNLITVILNKNTLFKLAEKEIAQIKKDDITYIQISTQKYGKSDVLYRIFVHTNENRFSLLISNKQDTDKLINKLQKWIIKEE